MKFHTQNLTVKEHGTGNCYQATLACLLDVEIHEVVNIEAFYCLDDWRETLNKFLKDKYGVRVALPEDVLIWHLENNLGRVTDFPEEFKDKPYMLYGNSHRGIPHVCIYQNGELLHDVHPDRTGLVASNEECSVSFLKQA